MRENYVVMLELPEAEYVKNTLQCSYNGLLLNNTVKLTPLQVMQQREMFLQIIKNLASVHPAGREKAKLQLFSLLAELLPEPEVKNVQHPAAAAMKKLIDEDLHFICSIKELNDRLGCCSLPYMRKLFYEEYAVTPGKYRNVLRMNRILELFAQSDMTLEMIADEVGMKHLPHLYKFLKSQQSLSPGKLLDQIRGERRI